MIKGVDIFIDEHGKEYKMIPITGEIGCYSLVPQGERITPEHYKWMAWIPCSYLSNAGKG